MSLILNGRCSIIHSSRHFIPWSGLWPVLVLCLLGSCGGGDSDREGTFVYYYTTDPPSLDPAKSFGVFDGLVSSMICSGLVQFDEAGNIQYDLIEDMKVSEDQRTFHFLLRENIKFPNGDPITAYDVKASFERLLDPTTRSTTTWVLERINGSEGYRKFKTQTQGQTVPQILAKMDKKEYGEDFDPIYLDGVPGIRIRDARIFEITLSEPYAPFLSLLAMPAARIVSVTSIAEVEAAGKTFDEYPSGSGPWKLESWVHDSEITLVPNETYYGEHPKLKRIRFLILPTDATAVNEFETGRLDVVTIPGQDVRRWLDNPEVKDQLQVIDELNSEFLAFNTTRKPFDDVRVRKAFVHAVDIKLILETIRMGLGTQAHGVIAPGLPGYVADRQPFPHDPQKAKELLAEAGYADGLDCEILLPSLEGIVRTYMEAIQAQLQAVNIRAKLTRAEWSTFRELRAQNEFDLCFYNWYADYPDADNFLYPLFHSTQNKRYRNFEFDRIVELAQRTSSRSERELIESRLNDPQNKVINPTSRKILEKQLETASDANPRVLLYQDADRLLYEDCAAIFLWHQSILQAVSERVQNYQRPRIFNGTQFLHVEVD